MIDKSSKILVIGAGSIGERHIQNLISSGYHNIYVYRQRNLPLRNIKQEDVTVFFNLEELDQIRPEVAFITSPTSMHLTQAIECAKRGIHLFIEKPLSHQTEGIQELKDLVRKKNIYLRVGYMMRFHPFIKKIKEAIEKRTYGDLLSFTTHWGEYLPDWHPWEDYRECYAAKKYLGGGAALTLSHDLDLVNWLSASPVKNYHLVKNTRSKLEVDVESGVDFILEYENGITGHVHLNFYEKIPERYYRFVFDDAIVNFNYFSNVLEVKSKKETVVVPMMDFERNHLFIDQINDFFKKVNTFNVEESIQQIEESELIIKLCQ